MANELHDHVLVIDTASGSNVSAANPDAADTGAKTISEEVRIRTIRFNRAAATDSCVIQNGDGRTLWESNGVASGPLQEESRLELRSRKGIRVTTLTAGKVYLYFGLDGGVGK